MKFDSENLKSYREDNRHEFKSAKGGLPRSLWETYSSFANTHGGEIILGVSEDRDGSLAITGINNVRDLEKEFWNTINNRNKVSANLLTEKDIEILDADEGKTVMVIHVPRAERGQKPVFINDDLFNGCYRRNNDGDYHCTREEVLAMLRDDTSFTADTKVLGNLSLDALNEKTISAYRNFHGDWASDHVWRGVTNEEFLQNIGAARRGETDGKLHPTAAGLLMFGRGPHIVSEFPYYFLDFREESDPSVRWKDRLQSDSGDWSGNLFDFFIFVCNRISLQLKIPFKLEGMRRVDDTPARKATREALLNCLANADYYQPRGVVVKITPESLILENPGNIRIGKEQMLLGGVSDPRNAAVLKMFNLVGFGERAGSGVPGILAAWQSEGWNDPEIEESFGPDRTRVTLPFTKKSEHVREHDNIYSSDYEKKMKMLVEYCSVPRTRSEMQEYAGLSSRSYFSRMYLAPLVDGGLLRPTIPEKPKSRNQRYVRTQSELSRK